MGSDEKPSCLCFSRKEEIGSQSVNIVVGLRRLGRASFYYEQHLTYWGLKRLVARFRVVDYTRKIIADPQRYAALELCRPGSLKQRLALQLCRLAYWAVPGYVFLLQKV